MKAVRAILGNEDVNTKCDPGRSRKKQKKKKLPPEKAGENRVKTRCQTSQYQEQQRMPSR